MNKKTMKEYRVWRGMKSRCYSPSQKRGYYKADHIKVCERWRNSFEAFLEDMGMMPDDTYSIERIDVNGDYCPENCKWIPQRDQPKNRRNCLVFTHDGKTMCLKDWARFFGIKYTTFHKWIHRQNMSFDECLKKINANKAKTPEGMFELEIPNDLKMVDDAIRDHYGIRIKKAQTKKQKEESDG